MEVVEDGNTGKRQSETPPPTYEEALYRSVIIHCDLNSCKAYASTIEIRPSMWPNLGFTALYLLYCIVLIVL